MSQQFLGNFVLRNSKSAFLRFCLLPVALMFLGSAVQTAVSGDAERDSDPGTLRVLSFNIWVDAQRGGVPQTAEVIKASKADLVGLQEVNKSGPELAERTGLTFVKQTKGGILTRYPVVETSKAGLGFRLDLGNGQFVWLYNVHLHHAPYQPYQLADIPYGAGNPFIRTAAEAIAEALRARGLELAALLMDLAPAIQAGEPIVITGDFNEPSHLDWTTAAAQAKQVPIPVNWPQSRALQDSGFQDAYRQLHSDPVIKPGYTWTPVPSRQDVPDRIDFVYQSGLKPVQAFVVGESETTSDLVVTPYPSDHRAVLIEFRHHEPPTK